MPHASCKFAHSVEGVSKKNRCYTCGAEGHVSNACPTRTDGGDAGKGKGKPKAKSAPGTPAAKDDAAKGSGVTAARSMATEPEPPPSAPTSPTTSENPGAEVKDAARCSSGSEVVDEFGLLHFFLYYVHFGGPSETT